MHHNEESNENDMSAAFDFLKILESIAWKLESDLRLRICALG